MVGLGAGTLFAVQAKGKYDDANEFCPSFPCDLTQAQDKERERISSTTGTARRRCPSWASRSVAWASATGATLFFLSATEVRATGDRLSRRSAGRNQHPGCDGRLLKCSLDAFTLFPCSCLSARRSPWRAAARTSGFVNIIDADGGSAGSGATGGSGNGDAGESSQGGDGAGGDGDSPRAADAAGSRLGHPERQ